MKIFEKIYLTLASLSGVVAGLGGIPAYIFNNEKLALITLIPFIVVFAIFGLDVIICELILRTIWGVDFTLFPVLFSKEDSKKS